MTQTTRRVATDVGGTFTDLVLFRGGKTETLKIPSTPGDPSEAFVSLVTRLSTRTNPTMGNGIRDPQLLPSPTATLGNGGPIDVSGSANDGNRVK